MLRKSFYKMIGFILLIGICVSGIYYFVAPVTLSHEYTGVLLKDKKFLNKANMVLNLTINRELLDRDKINGTLTIDDTTYTISNQYTFTSNGDILAEYRVSFPLKERIRTDFIEIFRKEHNRIRHRTFEGLKVEMDMQNYKYIVGDIISSDVWFVAPAVNDKIESTRNDK